MLTWSVIAAGRRGRGCSPGYSRHSLIFTIRPQLRLRQSPGSSLPLHVLPGDGVVVTRFCRTFR